MTAEIAIINKIAVALAADSAVTISEGYGRHKKTYDSEEKLFELSYADPVGIMISNDMNFCETPIQILIDRYRKLNRKFDRIHEYAKDFRQFLFDFSIGSNDEIRRRHVSAHVEPILIDLKDICEAKIWSIATRNFENDTISFPSSDNMQNICDMEIEKIRKKLNNKINIAELAGGAKITLSSIEAEIIKDCISDNLIIFNQSQKEKIFSYIEKYIRNPYRSSATTGVVIAGFGGKDLFPSLVSFDLHGVIGGALRYIEHKDIDVDRNGTKAAVLPFAQGGMVDRFLEGLDAEMQTPIRGVYDRLLQAYSAELIKATHSGNGARAKATRLARKARKVLLDKADHGLQKIRYESRSEIEKIVQFMPKSEMAHMAQALVNLTSIKHRISSGIATVGGPIDVAVISRSEGFVWIEQKHYFPGRLNPGYFKRMGLESLQNVE